MSEYETQYQELLTLLKQPEILSSVAGVLEWDFETMMPPKGAAYRAEQMATLSAVIHKQATNPRIGELLEALKNAPNSAISDDARAVVREISSDYERAIKLTPQFVEEMSRASSLSTEAWRIAREKNDFKIFEPHLKKIVELKKEYAKIIAPDEDPYQVLFEDFEPGMKVEDAAKLLAEVKEGIIPLIEKIAAKPIPRTNFLEGNVPEETQLPMLKELAITMGFDFEAGRLDTSTHPFSIWVGDSRVTVRFTQGYSEAVSALMHEVGHALYDGGIPRDGKLPLPIADARSLGVHESQSRLWENHVGLAMPFWKYFYPKLQKAYSPLAKVSLNEWLLAKNKVEPTFVRVGADEVTYPLHVILRFEIEQALIRGEIEVEEVPSIWNKKMKDYLGIEPPNDSLGVLQDIHWAQGSIGYFSTYVLGSALAAQLYECALKEIPSLEKELEKGNCKPLLNFLREKIHQHGERYETSELIKRATGKPLCAKDYIAYLEKKYTALYEL